MKQIKNMLFYSLLGVFFCIVFIRCEDDAKKAIAPEITYFEFGYENTDIVNFGIILNVNATVAAEAKIDKIVLEIEPKGTSLWAFDSTYRVYTGLNNASFNQNINIPFTTDTCAYRISFTVTDLDGNQTIKEAQFNVNRSASPQITEFELGLNNRASVNIEENLPVKATIVTEAAIDKILIEINPTGSLQWSYDTTILEYSGTKNASLNCEIYIPVDAEAGDYTFLLTVTDLEGNQTIKENELEIIYIEKPIVVPFGVVNGFIIDDNGSKLLATDKGLFLFNETKREYLKVESDLELLPVNDLAQVGSALLSGLWIGSNNGVLNISSQLHLTTENSDLLNNAVNRINIDNNDVLYFATSVGISMKKNEDWFENLGWKDLYSKFAITDLATATNGFTYVTTNGGGVERFKLDVDGISGATVFDTDWSQLRSNTVLTVFIDDTVQAYGTDNGAALHYSEYTKWDWENLTTAEGLVNDTVLSIVKDKENNWWFGTANGLSKLNGSEWTSYTTETHAIISNNIKFLAIDIDGSVWIATDKGLSQYKNGNWTNYKK